MNARVLELLRNPKKLMVEDFKLIESEIQSVPYVQSIRALYLYGIKKHSPQYYEEELSKTAAYTTDKKILYQFINGKIEREIEEEKNQESRIKNQQQTINNQEIEENSKLKTKNSEFENKAEEEKNQEIRAEVEIKIEEDKSQQPTINSQEIEKNSTPNPQNSEFEKESLTKINFHTEIDFISEVKIEKSQEKTKYSAPVRQKRNRHEVEMQQLLAEVEAKMKAKKNQESRVESQQPTTENQQIANHEISFAETATFEVEEKRDENQESRVKKQPVTSNQQPITLHSSWKPMSIATYTLDALLNENQESRTEKQKSRVESRETTNNSQPTIKSQELPVMNVSFFASEIKTIEEESSKNLTLETSESKKEQESNIPTFINTWQNWLKIDRAEEIQQEKEEMKNISIEEMKAKAIDKFIENEPKISQLKEDSYFVVKQNKEDISHLMTETLAKIYTEQKLYSKAIKGYKILIKKYPEKEKYFFKKIKEIKEIRGI